MSVPPKPPDQRRPASSCSPGFWSQDHLHIRPHQTHQQQQQQQHSSATHRLEGPKGREQERSRLHRQRHWELKIYHHQPTNPNSLEEDQRTGQERPYRSQQGQWEPSIRQQQHHGRMWETAPPAPIAPQPYGYDEPYVHSQRAHRTMWETARQPQPHGHGKPYVHSQGAHNIDTTCIGQTGYLYQPQHPPMSMGTTEFMPSVQPYGQPHSNFHTFSDQFGRDGPFIPQDMPRTQPETEAFGHHPAEPNGKAYSQPVCSVESDQARRAEVPSTTPNLSATSEQPSSCDDRDTAQPKAVRAPRAPDVDLYDQSLPVYVRYAAWKKFTSETAMAYAQWERDGRPACDTENCRDRDHAPPHRSAKAVDKLRGIKSVGDWLETVCNGLLPCFSCGRIHKGLCPAPKCSSCGKHHLDKFSCSKARKWINTARQLHQQRLEKKRQKELREEQKKQHRMQQMTQQQQQSPAPSTTRPPTPSPPQPPPEQQPSNSMKLKPDAELMKVVVASIPGNQNWSAEQWGSFFASYGSAMQQLAQSRPEAPSRGQAEEEDSKKRHLEEGEIEEEGELPDAKTMRC